MLSWLDTRIVNPHSACFRVYESALSSRWPDDDPAMSTKTQAFKTPALSVFDWDLTPFETRLNDIPFLNFIPTIKTWTKHVVHDMSEFSACEATLRKPVSLYMVWQSSWINTMELLDKEMEKWKATLIGTEMAKNTLTVIKQKHGHCKCIDRAATTGEFDGL